MKLAVSKLKPTIPYFTYVILWAVMSFLASQFLPRENFGVTANSAEEALALTKAHLWKKELLRTGLQLLVIPCAVFGALHAGRLSVRGLFTTAVILYLSMAIYLQWVLDKLVSPDQASFFSSKGLLEYPFWEFIIWQLAVSTIVPILALVAIRHLTRRLSGTPSAPLN